MATDSRNTAYSGREDGSAEPQCSPGRMQYGQDGQQRRDSQSSSLAEFFSSKGNGNRQRWHRIEGAPRAQHLQGITKRLQEMQVKVTEEKEAPAHALKNQRITKRLQDMQVRATEEKEMLPHAPKNQRIPKRLQDMPVRVTAEEKEVPSHALKTPRITKRLQDMQVRVTEEKEMPSQSLKNQRMSWRPWTMNQTTSDSVPPMLEQAAPPCASSSGSAWGCGGSKETNGEDRVNFSWSSRSFGDNENDWVRVSAGDPELEVLQREFPKSKRKVPLPVPDTFELLNRYQTLNPEGYREHKNSSSGTSRFSAEFRSPLLRAKKDSTCGSTFGRVPKPPPLWPPLWEHSSPAKACAPPTTSSSCPICTEVLDETDSLFAPCACGFKLCLFCHHKIATEDGRCPSCRKTYRWSS